MTTEEAINQLRQMQGQIVHGSNVFGDIADLIVTLEAKIKPCNAAIHHVLDAIAYDPRKYWLMGELTESWARLTAAGAALWGKSVEEIKQEFQPDKAKFDRYCAEVEANDKLLTYCREKGITGQ